MNPIAHDYLLEATKRMRKLSAQIELCESDDDLRVAIGACFSYVREVQTAALMASQTLDGKPKPKVIRREYS